MNLRLSFTPESRPEEAAAPTEPQKAAKAPEVEEGVPPTAAATGPDFFSIGGAPDLHRPLVLVEAVAHPAVLLDGAAW